MTVGHRPSIHRSIWALFAGAFLATIHPLTAQQPVEVVPGDAALTPTVIRPHVATWQLVRAASGAPIGGFQRTIEFVHHTAEEPAILTQWHFQTPQRSALDIYYVDRETLLPFARYVTSPNGMWVQYQSADRLVANLTRRTGGEPVYVDITSPGPRFNNAMLDFILASLPLAEGYQVRIPTLSTSGASMQEALGTIEARVEGQETVTLPDGSEVTAWRVAIQPSSGNAQIVWIAKEPPYLLRRDAIGRGGTVTVRWELTAVRER